MLVFTRKRHEAIMIGDGVEVRVLRVGRDGVRLGVTAPPQVAVHRREIYEQIREENRVAAQAVASADAIAAELRGRLGTSASPAPAHDAGDDRH
ncbi:MAG TPA: carbon storage regulator CsrA [Vicinamibacterales bacterium]